MTSHSPLTFSQSTFVSGVLGSRAFRRLATSTLPGTADSGALAIWGVRVFDASLVPAVKPPYVDFSMDATVFAYLAAITLGAHATRMSVVGEERKDN